MSGKTWLTGGIVSLDPLITYSGGGSDAFPFGLAGLCPERFRGQWALHIVVLPRPFQRYDTTAFTAEARRLTAELENNSLIFAAADDYECALLTAEGLSAFPAPHVAMVDEAVFRPVAPEPGAPLFEAAFIGRPGAASHDDLAAGVESLMYIGTGPAGDDDPTRVWRVLPHARLASPATDGEGQTLAEHEVPAALARCGVGVALGQDDDATRDVMAYLLCGLPVVATPGTASRSRYLAPPYALIVEPTADAVAKGVREMNARQIPRQVIRDHIARIVTFERHHFLNTINFVTDEHFGTGELFESVAPFIAQANSRSPAASVIAALDETGVRPARVARAPKRTTLAFVLGHPRTGTNMFRSIFGQAPQVFPAGEVFVPRSVDWLPHSFHRFLAEEMGRLPSWQLDGNDVPKLLEGYLAYLHGVAKKPVVVIDAKWDQLGLLDWPPHPLDQNPRLLSFIERGPYPIIHMRRRDHLSRQASLMRAMETSEWVLTRAEGGEQGDRRRIHMNPQRVMAGLRSTLAVDRMVEDLLGDRADTLELYYEDLVLGDRLTDATRTSIEDLLDIDLPADAMASTAKIAPPLRDLVENLDEVLDVLSGTELAWIADMHR